MAMNDQWQPIDTFRHTHKKWDYDFYTVLLTDGKLVSMGHPTYDYDDDGTPRLYCWCSDEEGRRLNPTHWMPLPRPPGKKEERYMLTAGHGFVQYDSATEMLHAVETEKLLEYSWEAAFISDLPAIHCACATEPDEAAAQAAFNKKVLKALDDCRKEHHEG